VHVGESLVTMISIFNSWFITSLIMSWSDQSNRRRFRWSMSRIF